MVMAAHAPVPRLVPDDALQEIDALLDELSRLADTDATVATYHAQWLERVGRGLGSSAGMILQHAPETGWRSEVRFDQTGEQLVERLSAAAVHAGLPDDV